MHLKRMELFGFKSFAEKSELDFGSGIAAVIGPNGCGKSNLVDAVRWALGEQSVKSLRGTRMDEVIFSGSESRKPLNFAEVSLTFDNAASFLNLEYDEITITRRLFRTGDSEYYINKSPCRLKDITELFLDTGLGKDVYSVIGQGRVEEIINSRPEERREIFEEAAGIFKYKLRKREARRRLEETRENLVRVQDLIFELEMQVKPLQEQAEVTRQYRLLRQRIEEAEKKVLSYNLLQSRQQLEKTNKQLQAVSDAQINAAAESSMQEKEKADLQNRQQDFIAQKNDCERKLNQIASALEKQHGELRLLHERESRFSDQIEQAKQRVEQLTLLMTELNSQKEKAARELEQRQQHLEQSKIELVDLQEELTGHETSALAGEVQEQQEKIYQAGNRREAAASTIEELKRQLDKLAVQKKEHSENTVDLRNRLSTIESSIKTAELEEQKLQQQLEQAAAEEKESSENLEQARTELENLAESEQRVREDIRGVGSRLNLLQEQETVFSGYYRGVKEVLQQRSALPGIVGPVADLISIDSRYVQAVESALGSALQYLVASTEQSVQEAINYLKKNKRGWATFLPLDILQEAADPLERYPGWRDLNGVIGKASELVSIDNAYRKIVDYLMSAILVCHSMKDASGAARFIKYSCRVVTLEGEMINPGGIIRGGSFTRHSSGQPLGRRSEIETLQQQQSSLSSQLADLQGKVKAAREKVVDCGNRVSKKASAYQNLIEQLAGRRKNSETLRQDQVSLKQQILSAQQSLEHIAAEEVELLQRVSVLENDIKTCLHQISSMENELAGKRESYQQFLNTKKELEQKVTGAMVKMSAYSEQCEALAERIKEIEHNINRPAAEIEEKKAEDDQFHNELTVTRETIKKVEQAIQGLNEQKAGLLLNLEEISKQLNAVEAELTEQQEHDRRSQGRAARQDKRERQLSMEQTRLQTEINYQEIRFRELFRSLELAELDDQFEPQETEILVDNLKEDLEELGEVNLGAIEELTRLEDRINFLKSQQDDLKKGETSLRKVLDEIDQRMEHYFHEAFKVIVDNFKHTFEELFEGGQVLLKLTDPDDALESGIEIVAQPPGKKLQNINLLSAGEKVLTAIALVFAILRFKPAPFYLLDEVESTLDDANLARFTRFLQASAKQAQFILITHRKRTMEEAEVLYGVTMPEPGVSKLMSLKLDDIQKPEVYSSK